MSDDRWSLLSFCAASAGTAIAVPVGGGVGLLVVRALGYSESIANYGPPFVATVATACCFGLLGCYLALRLVGDARAFPTTLILTALLPGSALSVEPFGQALARMFDLTFGTLIPLGVVLYVSCPIVSPVVARIIAGLFRTSRSQV